MRTEKIIEWEIVTGENEDDADIDHVNWRVAKKLMEHPEDDLIEVRRVIRWGNEEEGEIRRLTKVMWSKDKNQIGVEEEH